MALTNAATAPAGAAADRVGSARLPALLAILLGLVLVGFAGFSHSTTIHNAAHDTRHANAFPCH